MEAYVGDEVGARCRIGTSGIESDLELPTSERGEGEGDRTGSHPSGNGGLCADKVRWR